MFKIKVKHSLLAAALLLPFAGSALSAQHLHVNDKWKSARSSSRPRSHRRPGVSSCAKSAWSRISGH
jgi:hypothetical protein